MAAIIRDARPKIIFIPLLGICLPVACGIITYSLYSFGELILANLFFILTTFIIWVGSNQIHLKFRPLYLNVRKPFSKMVTVCFVSALYGYCIGILACLIWINYCRELFKWKSIYRFPAACAVTVIVVILLYEIVFLWKEKELDTTIVDQLDRERTQAELQALANELDPHFIFNSLNTLNHLILILPEQAHLFNSKLSQVYKYFLINKHKEFISLQEEMDFIENYFFLLQIRHDDKLQLEVELNTEEKKMLIPPFALQLLVENALKHNEFTDENHLIIKIGIHRQYLQVSNNIQQKSSAVASTGIGLKNLRARYKILFGNNIIVQKDADSFIVRLPLVK